MVSKSTPTKAERAHNDLRILQLLSGRDYIIRLYKSQEEPQALFELLEFAKNGDLDSFLRKSPGQFRQDAFVLGFFRRIVAGVLAVHKAGFCHADLKLENVVVGADLSPKIIDFDLSVPLDSFNYGRGTTQYMDPEIIGNWGLRQSQYTEKTDVYSLGVMLYQLVHLGQYPFAGEKLEEIRKALNNRAYTIA